MKYRLIFGIVLMLCFSSCTGFFDKDDESFTGDEEPANIWFDNSANTWLSVSVYSSSDRENLIETIPGGRISGIHEWAPSPDGYRFYLIYHLPLWGIIDTIPYMPNKIGIDIFETIILRDETTSVIIPDLDRLDRDEALFDDVHIIVNNTSGSTLSFAKGSGSSFTPITPLNRTNSLVNNGSTVIYRVASGDASTYAIRGGGSDYSLPAGLTSFKKGYLYTLNFTGSAVVTAAAEKLLTLNNL